MLSELEGAVLLEIELRGRKTAFQVRKAFLRSPTIDWSGSAGAVYPAIARLEREGLLVSQLQADNRGTKRLKLTKLGLEAMHSWATDPELATNLGADPFRTRLDYITALPPAQRKIVVERIQQSLTAILDEIEVLLTDADGYKHESNSHARDLVRLRLDRLSPAK